MNDIIKGLKEFIKPPHIDEIDLTLYKAICDKHEGMFIGVLGEDIDGLCSYSEGDYVFVQPYTVEDGFNRMFTKELENYVKHCTISKLNYRFVTNESNMERVSNMVHVPLKYIKYKIKL